MKYKIGDIVTLKGYDDLKSNPVNKKVSNKVLFSLSNRKMEVIDIIHHKFLGDYYNCIYENLKEDEKGPPKMIYENEIKEEFKLPDELFQM